MGGGRMYAAPARPAAISASARGSTSSSLIMRSLPLNPRPLRSLQSLDGRSDVVDLELLALDLVTLESSLSGERRSLRLPPLLLHLSLRWLTLV